MKIARAFFSILVTLLGVVLAVNFIRYLVLGRSDLSLYSFLQLLSEVDFDASQFFIRFYEALSKLVSVRDLLNITNYFWSGKTVLDKILSIFTGFYYYFRDLFYLIINLFQAVWIFLGCLWNFIRFLYGLMGSLFGFVFAG